MDISGQEGENQAWQVSAPKQKSRKDRQPAVATRTSSIIPKTGGPIVEKATNRLQERDEIIGGNTNHNPFTVLNNTPDSHLHNVIKDLDIAVEGEGCLSRSQL